MEHANDYAASSRGSFFGSYNDGFVRMLEAAGGSGAAPRSGGGQAGEDRRPIILQANERELARAVMGYQNRQNKVKTKMGS